MKNSEDHISLIGFFDVDVIFKVLEYILFVYTLIQT